MFSLAGLAGFGTGHLEVRDDVQGNADGGDGREDPQHGVIAGEVLQLRRIGNAQRDGDIDGQVIKANRDAGLGGGDIAQCGIDQRGVHQRKAGGKGHDGQDEYGDVKLHEERGRHQRAGDKGESGVDGGARGQNATDLAGENTNEDGANIARDHQQGGLIDVHAVQVMCGKWQQENEAHLGGVDEEDHEDGPHIAAVSKELRGDHGVLGVADVDDEAYDAPVVAPLFL